MQPLTGTKVIELCHIAAGPFAGMLLADMGADVIKVESPEGNGMRGWPPYKQGYSENFASLNRNKRSVVLNLKDTADLAAALRDIWEAECAKWTAAECLDIMRRQGVPCAPINSYSQALANPQVAH